MPEGPRFSHMVHDAGRKLTFDVRAYRPLSSAEIVQAIREYRAKAYRALSSVDVIVIATSIGLPPF